MKSYLLNEDELDAEAFARLFVQKSTGLFYTYEDDNITKKLIERAEQFPLILMPMTRIGCKNHLDLSNEDTSRAEQSALFAFSFTFSTISDQ